jgi:hypothetical protein
MQYIHRYHRIIASMLLFAVLASLLPIRPGLADDPTVDVPKALVDRIVYINKWKDTYQGTERTRALSEGLLLLTLFERQPYLSEQDKIKALDEFRTIYEQTITRNQSLAYRYSKAGSEDLLKALEKAAEESPLWAKLIPVVLSRLREWGFDEWDEKNRAGAYENQYAQWQKMHQIEDSLLGQVYTNAPGTPDLALLWDTWFAKDVDAKITDQAKVIVEAHPKTPVPIIVKQKIDIIGNKASKGILAGYANL